MGGQDTVRLCRGTDGFNGSGGLGPRRRAHGDRACPRPWSATRREADQGGGWVRIRPDLPRVMRGTDPRDGQQRPSRAPARAHRSLWISRRSAAAVWPNKANGDSETLAGGTGGRARLRSAKAGRQRNLSWRAKAKDIHVPSRGIRGAGRAGTAVAGEGAPVHRSWGRPTRSAFTRPPASTISNMRGSAGEARMTRSAGLLHLTRDGSAAPRRKGVVGHRSPT